MANDTASQRWDRYRAAIRGEPLPCALVDLDAVDANVARLAVPLAGGSKTLRIATKSLRSPALVRHIASRLGRLARGLMTYTASETAFWASEGEGDLLLAYPTLQPADAQLLARANADGASAAVVVDCAEHLEPLAAAGRDQGTRIPLVVEIDLAWRPLGALTHVGVRRSALRSSEDVIALARRIAATPGLRFHGVMGYEAQIAGVPDAGAVTRLMKAASGTDVQRKRGELARALVDAGFAPTVFNGGGTGSLAACARETALTEVTAGSGFVDSHLFDRYDGLELEPAAYFALQVVRRPAPGIVTCHGGGYIASGRAGRDRLPVPALPEGLRLLSLEGAGEVQTPLALASGETLRLGDPVFFRHAKAGELAEHFNEYLLVRGGRIEARAPTYRGLGKAFLG
jgi:D-serine deaminase-like pyridoxal phosphate-dependent protein